MFSKDSLHFRILFHLISLCQKLLIIWLSCLESWHKLNLKFHVFDETWSDMIRDLYNLEPTSEPELFRNYKMTDSSYWYKKAFKKCFLFSFINDCQSFIHCEWVIELWSFNIIRDDVNFRLFLSTRFVLSW